MHVSVCVSVDVCEFMCMSVCFLSLCMCLCVSVGAFGMLSVCVLPCACVY